MCLESDFIVIWSLYNMFLLRLRTDAENMGSRQERKKKTFDTRHYISKLFSCTSLALPALS